MTNSSQTASTGANRNPLSTQEGGSHYNKLPYQPLQFAMENQLDPCAFSILRYLTRFQDKGTPLLDLQKALHYLDLRQHFRDSGLPAAQPRTEGLRIPMSRYANQPEISSDSRVLLTLFAHYLQEAGRGTALRTTLNEAIRHQERAAEKPAPAVHQNPSYGYRPPSPSVMGSPDNTESED